MRKPSPNGSPVPASATACAASATGFAAAEVFDEAATEAVVRDTIAEFEVKGGEVIHPVRVAISGRTTGPGLFETIAVLGRERCLRRLDRALGMVRDSAG